MTNEFSRTKQAVRIGEDWESFLNEHPEIQVKTKDNNIVDVIFPNDATNRTLIILSGYITHLEYCLGDEHVRYTSPDAHKSKIYELVEEYNKNFTSK